MRLIGSEPGGYAERLKLMDTPASNAFDNERGLRVAHRLTVLGCMVSVMVLAGCGSSNSPGVDGPVMRYPERSSSQEGMAAEVRGVLELDGEYLYVALDEVGER